jgi:hypothetical protein
MPAPSCPHHSMQSTGGGQGRMLGERDALGAMLGAGGMGQVYRPVTACSSARSDQDARSPVCAGAGLGGPVHASSAGRCQPEPSQHCRRLRRAPRPACTIWSGIVEAQSAAAAPTSRCRSSTAWRQGRRAGRRARQGPRPAGPARPRRGLTGSPERAASARVGGHRPSQPRHEEQSDS